MTEQRRLRTVSADAVSARGVGLSMRERAAALIAAVPAVFDVERFAVADPRFGSVLSGPAASCLDISGLPEAMRAEMAWWVASCDASGGRRLMVPAWKAWVEVAAVAAGDRGVGSFAAASVEDWMRWWASEVYARRGRTPGVASCQSMRSALGPLLSALEVAYSPAEWWRHDTWDLTVDSRIPRRAHEPRGAHPVRFADVGPAWLAEGMKFYLRVRLESGYWAWTSVHAQRSWIAVGLVDFLAERHIDHPALCDDPDRQLRPLALELASFLRARPGRRAQTPTAETTSRCLEAVACFYAFMADYRSEAAAALGDRRWERLSDAHARLYRPEEIGRAGRRGLHSAEGSGYIADSDLARMFACIELVGAARDHTMSLSVDGARTVLAGLGDPSAMRAWILQALTGRRASEILMIDFDPLEAIPGLDVAAVAEGAMVAKLRYRQTKIDGAPETILIGTDVIEVIAEQQAWVRERLELGDHERVPYLFPALANNPRGLRPRGLTSYLARLRQLDDAVRLTDGHRRPLRFSKSHRLRHTKATTLLNLGAPIHVVQRYMGHLSPEMTMHYAATLASTAEREFLALAKVNRDGRELDMDRQDLLDLVSLDRRADRILPNGYCLLPPTKVCEKGNACHTCDHFATDRSYLPDIIRQLAETEALVAARQDQHRARHGEPMAATNVWLSQRNVEMEAMRREISALQTHPADSGHAVRGPGVLARPAYQSRPVTVTLDPRPNRPPSP